MKVLVTGTAGFIGSELTIRLLAKGYEVIGIDSHNDYYDQQLKEDRVKRFINNKNYKHKRINISDSNLLKECFEQEKPNIVVNLAAQAGVRYSIENPKTYIENNVVGFSNILEECRHSKVEHLVYASSSSVYGANSILPFSTNQKADQPLNLYAATKKSNELMAHAYSHLFKIQTTGIRFFTVYGPWGRPDMALHKFTKAILQGEPIKLFNNGKHTRDFTYIDDVVEGVLKIIEKNNKNEKNKSKLYNLGNSEQVKLIDFIATIENEIGIKANIELYPLQQGDVLDTQANIDEIINDYNYKPKINYKEGIKKFVKWYKNYYKEN